MKRQRISFWLSSINIKLFPVSNNGSSQKSTEATNVEPVNDSIFLIHFRSRYSYFIRHVSIFGCAPTGSETKVKTKAGGDSLKCGGRVWFSSFLFLLLHTLPSNSSSSSSSSSLTLKPYNQ
ncbi:MAG: hypothetical protein IH591_00645 [Bacteroidales bacterium]|nr:hypothetical protein [Bacteroidales bacterium]